MQSIRVLLPSVFLTSALFVLCRAAEAEAVNLTRHGDTIAIEIGAASRLRHTLSLPNISKAFLEPLRDAKGTIVTRSLAVGNEIPPGHEHDKGFEPHQRGMYFGHGDVDGYSFWIEEAFKKYYSHSTPAKYGRMVFRKLDEMKSGPSSGVIRASFDLAAPDKKPFAEETQEYKIQRRREHMRVIDSVREQIEQTKVQIEQAERQYDLNKVAELRYGTLAQLQKDLATEEERLAKKDGARLSKEEVDEDDIAGIIARWTGIPVTQLLQGEKQKLLHLEDELHQRVIGQDEAVDELRRPFCAPVRGLRIRIARLVRSYSSAPPAWARPNWRARSRSICSTTNAR